MPNLLDLMTPEDRDIAHKNYLERKSGNTAYRKGMSIPPDIFIVAQLGYFYGWGAIETVKRGYVESFEVINKDGKRIEKRTKIPFTMEEASILVEAARKISYSGVVDAARGTQIAVGSVMSKNPRRAFKDGIKPYVEGAKP